MSGLSITMLLYIVLWLYMAIGSTRVSACVTIGIELLSVFMELSLHNYAFPDIGTIIFPVIITILKILGWEELY